MAKVVKNKKKFKVIEVSLAEVVNVFGGFGICDWCNEDFNTGYYIAVLNHCYCKKCYNSWLNRAVRYDVDRDYENKSFELRKKQLNIE